MTSLPVVQDDIGRDALEVQLLRAWEHVLGVDSVSLTDDFFDLGGSSLNALRLVDLVEEMTGRALPLAEFLSEPTVAATAAAMRRALPAELPDPLVHLSTGSERVLLGMHSVTGAVMRYAKLARRLPGTSVSAFQSRALLGRRPEEVSVEALAHHYADRSIAAFPSQPLSLIGYSMGGLIAYEMARQLGERGRPVDNVLLIETSADSPDDAPTPLEILAGSLGVRDSIPGLREGSEGELIRDIVRMVRPTNRTPPDYDETEARLVLRIIEANVRAARRYRPREYAGDVTLLKAEFGHTNGAVRSQDLGWSKHAPLLRVIDLPGNHYTVFSDEGIPSLAEAIQLVV